MGLKWTEILLILFALMLLFGASRLPQMGSSLGAAIRNFKKGFSSEVEEKSDEKKLSSNDSPPIASTDKTATKQG
ncbi:MAG: twin-arginine translocase TatA/TatE family subunit [Archangium sp.]|nr:twin-arginine translocase TatA/TatE family subunit [Archangium sp.]MDP3571023.1 twin-arginine translocase TatA/TatE family subunit [Archangium sp.]